MSTLSPELKKTHPYLDLQYYCASAEATCRKTNGKCHHTIGATSQYKKEGLFVISILTDKVTSCADCPTARQHQK